MAGQCELTAVPLICSAAALTPGPGASFFPGELLSPPLGQECTCNKMEPDEKFNYKVLGEL